MNINARSLAFFLVTLAHGQCAMGAAPAGEYRLDKGRGVEVCEAYEKNLISVKPDPGRGVGICPIPLAKDMSGLTEPNWQGRYVGVPMPLAPDVDLRELVNDYIWERGVNPANLLIERDAKRWRGTPAEYAKARNHFEVRRARYYDDPSYGAFYAEFDIDNDGLIEPVYHDSRDCDYLGMGSLLFVLKPDYSGLDKAKTDRVMFYPARAKDTPLFHEKPDPRLRPGASPGPTADAMRDARYGVFQHSGRTYLTVTGFNPVTLRDRDPTIHVYQLNKERREEVCSYSYSNQ